MRLIDADKIGLTDFEIIQCDGDYKRGLALLIEKLNTAPTIKAEPKHGHWIEDYENVYECSECESVVITDQFTPIEVHRFCRGCGAIMDEVEND